MSRIHSIYLIDETVFSETIKKSFTMSEALRVFGQTRCTTSFKTLEKRAKELGLEKEVERLVVNRSNRQKLNILHPARALSEILVEFSNYQNTKFLKIRLIKNGLLKNQCSICGLNNVWNDKLIVLHLDHINGNRQDNRIENLRILCPNCHSQTDTFAGKNVKIRN